MVVCGLALLVERHVERLQHLYRQIVLLPDIFVFVVLQFQHQVLALLSTLFRQALEECIAQIQHHHSVVTGLVHVEQQLAFAQTAAVPGDFIMET
jgi:hypothetical protein